MLIKSLYIENFRCYKSQFIDFERMTAILGRNGSGKTTILAALETFYETKSTIGTDDFYNQDLSLTIKIRVIFSEFRIGEEQDTFSTYIENGEMPVTKVISFKDGAFSQKYFASTKQIPQFADIRSIPGKQEKAIRINELADTQELPGLEKMPLRGGDADTVMNNYEEKHPSLLRWCEREEQFFGAKNIGGGRLDKYTKFVRVPAVRDVMEEVADKRGSPINQLLDVIVMRRIESRDDVKKLHEDFERRIQEVYSPDNLIEIKDLENEINSSLQALAPNAGIGLSWGEPRIPEISYPTIIPQLEEDGYRGAINRKGHGVQRALIFSLLQNLALVNEINESISNQIKKATEEVLSGEPISVQTTFPDLIIAIDEPELYQHPLRSKHLMSVLREMAESNSENSGRNQLIYTTHSQYFVELKYFSEIRIVRKQKQSDIHEAPCSKVSKYSLSEAAIEMARINNDADDNQIGKYTDTTFFVRCYPVMTTIVSEGFFADAVVLVEGLTEVAFLSTIAEILNADLVKKGIAIIPVNGKANLDRAGIIFKGLDIPTYIIFDGDKSKRDTKNILELNKRIQRIFSDKPEDFPADSVYRNYACFEDEIETYCRKEIGEKEYSNLLESLANEYGYNKPSEVLKNFEVACDFVKRVYTDGKKLPLLEAIVKGITNLIN